MLGAVDHDHPQLDPVAYAEAGLIGLIVVLDLLRGDDDFVADVARTHLINDHPLALLLLELFEGAVFGPQGLGEGDAVSAELPPDALPNLVIDVGFGEGIPLLFELIEDELPIDQLLELVIQYLRPPGEVLLFGGGGAASYGQLALRGSQDLVTANDRVINNGLDAVEGHRNLGRCGE